MLPKIKMKLLFKRTNRHFSKPSYRIERRKARKEWSSIDVTIHWSTSLDLVITFQPPWTDNNPLARMTHISAQWSYFETKRRAKSLSLGGGGGSSLEPVALNPVVESASGSAVARCVDRGDHGSVKRRKEKGASRCAHAGPKKKTVFGRVRRKWNGLRENERPGAYMGAIEPVTFIREPVFVHGLSSRATDLIYPRHASLLSRRHLHMRIASPIGILHASWTQFPSGHIFCRSNRDDSSMNRDFRQFFFFSFFSDYFLDQLNVNRWIGFFVEN